MATTLTDYADKSALIKKDNFDVSKGSNLQNWQELQNRMRKKIEKVKAEMGAKLSCHPDYRLIPRHSLMDDNYIPARQEYLDEIKRRAAKDREKNPACIQAKKRVSK